MCPDQPRRPDTVPDLLAAAGRTRIMGILNVTADSFSDGGRYLNPGPAVAHGLGLAANGADIVDVGGESTRPGAQRVPAEVETAGVVPVVRELARAGVVVSIDTTRASVARAAVDAGARLVNDVSGGLADPEMAAAVAETGVPYVAMHWRAPSADMHRFTDYDDVVDELARRLDALAQAGVDPGRVVIDPGLGFAKTPEQNWTILGRLEEFDVLGRPVLVGASRKAFLGTELAVEGVVPPSRDRDTATAAVSAIAAAHGGVFCLRVHDVVGTLHATRVGAAVRRARSAGMGRSHGETALPPTPSSAPATGGSRFRQPDRARREADGRFWESA